MGERSIRIRVPGTSANCGPGFDSLGLACTVYNELTLSLTHEPRLDIKVTGEGAADIPVDERNMVWRSVQYLLEQAQEEDHFQGCIMRMENHIPLSRGLGSSAAAIVAGLRAANVLIDNRFNRREIMQFATELEGHPDNVGPAIFGGFTVSIVNNGKVDTCSFLPKVKLKLVAAVPDFPLDTKLARQALPEVIPFKDAVFNVGHASMLVAALCRGNERYLRHSLTDAMHQNYRAKLIPGLQEVFRMARYAGALGAVISGAGPTIRAFVLERDQCASAVADAMVAGFAQNGVKANALVLDVDTKGAHIVNEWT
ncbi:MAG: homoserine kinase [Selenomonadaceae bacterium]|nr:homoserine kinase [Selenomonadaceae bacterium]